MAIGARFSNHPNIKTDPPYWAGERFAEKAISLINASLLEPSIPNVQFWGIMSCLEYGRAAGSKAWSYGGIAVRMCQELTLDKEETLKTPITTPDGSLDKVAMALRRRIFWSCFCIDKFSSTSTNRPQGFETGEYDVEWPTLEESKLLWEPFQASTVDKVLIEEDPLMDAIIYYLSVLEIFGEVAKTIDRARADSTSALWPPSKNYDMMSQRMRQWADELPEQYQFTPVNVKRYRETASQNYLNYWLCAHTLHCAGMLILNRGSLAYNDLSASEVSVETYKSIKMSIATCKEYVDLAMEVFVKLRDYCGSNILPYMGYAAYIFASVLMTSAFSSDHESYNKSSSYLSILFDTIKLLRPYWPVGERLAITTNDLLSVHSKLYDGQDQEAKIRTKSKQECFYNVKSAPSNGASMPPVSNDIMIPSSGPPIMNNSPAPVMPFSTFSAESHLHPYGYNQLLSANGNEIDFNSCEFLNDSALFGQMVLDTTKPPVTNMLNYCPPLPHMIPPPTTTANASYPIVEPMYPPYPYSYQQQHQ
ncbi:fungal-specific transcription factor domain-containing protein [Sporodiniella umbellata]|nr:fungal-specific transcription factor domain-containing protein [Sporodiniella umbellata]